MCARLPRLGPLFKTDCAAVCAWPLQVCTVPALVRAFGRSSVLMGADCCGAEEGVQALTLEDKNGAVPAKAAQAKDGSSVRSHEEFVQDKQPFYSKRIALFEQYLKREAEKREKAREASEKLTVVLPDGSEKTAIKGATTPQDMARDISTGLAKKVVMAHVDGKEWDINRPLEANCSLKLFGSDTPEGLDVRALPPCFREMTALAPRGPFLPSTAVHHTCCSTPADRMCDSMPLHQKASKAEAAGALADLRLLHKSTCRC